MFEYATVFFKRLFGMNPFGPDKAKPKKYEYKEPEKKVEKQKEYVKPKPKEKESYPEFSYSGSGMSIVSVATMAVVGIVVISIFGSVYTALNTTALGPGSEALTGMMGLIPLVLVAVMVMGMLTTILRVM